MVSRRTFDLPIFHEVALALLKRADDIVETPEGKIAPLILCSVTSIRITKTCRPAVAPERQASMRPNFFSCSQRRYWPIPFVFRSSPEVVFALEKHIVRASHCTRTFPS
jgi:hypothetical protein